MVKCEIKVATRFEKEENLTNRVKMKKRIHKRFQSTKMKKWQEKAFKKRDKKEYEKVG